MVGKKSSMEIGKSSNDKLGKENRKPSNGNWKINLVRKIIKKNLL